MLTTEQQKAREGLLTASRVSALMSGDDAEVYGLWRELIGDPLFRPENLDDVWAVQLGSCTEPLNLDWFEREHGVVSRRGDVIIHPLIDWAACTLDGWSGVHQCPIEAKHVGGREPFDTIMQRYQPQMHWQMFVTEADKVALSVIMGASAPVVEFVPRDDSYLREMVKRAHEFMEHVFNLTPPVVMPDVPSPVKPVREYNMTGNNEWALHAADWIANANGKKIAEKADKALRAMVPADATRCHGYDVQITRMRNGNLRLTQIGN